MIIPWKEKKSLLCTVIDLRDGFKNQGFRGTKCKYTIKCTQKDAGVVPLCFHVSYTYSSLYLSPGNMHMLKLCKLGKTNILLLQTNILLRFFEGTSPAMRKDTLVPLFLENPN